MASGLAGIEVPIIGSDSVNWTELSFPSSPAADSNSDLFIPALTRDFASCSAVGDPPTYLSWRVQKSAPNCAELLELSANKELPRTGLRFCFPEVLSSLVFVCKNEVDGDSRRFPYLVCAVTVRGFAYLVRVRNKPLATVMIVPSSEEVVSVFDLRSASISSSDITSGVAMPNGCLILGTTDGSLACFDLATAPPSLHELRDDTGIARLWGLVSRGRVIDAVQDLSVSEFHGKKILFVLHLDGILRVWDLSNRTRISSHNMNVPAMAGATSVRLWVSKANTESAIFSLAILSRHTTDVSSETIMLYSLHCSLGDKLSLLLDPSITPISFLNGRCIDVKFTSDKIWILKENGLLVRRLSHTDTSMNEEETSCYTLQEEFVADQLFQSRESSVDHLLLMSHSIFSPAKDKISKVVSSIFLQRLLHPGVYQSVAFRATFLEYNRHTDIQSLTADGLKKEIMIVIEDEGVGADLTSIFCSWKMFCARYFRNWCKSNAPCGLLIEPITGSVGLIRTNSVSLFRCPEDIERLLHGSSTEVVDLTSFKFNSFDDKRACEILVDLLRCVSSISQQLGKPASVLFYESLINRHVFPSEEIVPCMLKVLETGYSSTVTAFGLSDFGTRTSWEERLTDHKKWRKFSINMLLSLHSLCEKATTWSKVLNAIENYLKFLVPQKIIETISGDPMLSINASILIQATSQIAKVMFESSFHIVLFLGYLVDNSGQVHMMPDDISKIQLELVPMVQEIISEWLIIYFFTTTPSESAAVEDFSSQLSLLQIDSNTVRRSWNDKLGNCDFPLALIFLLNPQSSRYLHSMHLPKSDEIVTSVRQFSSWIIWGKFGNSSTLFAHSTELALILLRHGQYDAVECLHGMIEAHKEKEKTLETVDENWCKLQHLRGCCLLAKVQRGLNIKGKEKITSEAVRCFFRVSSVKGAVEALQSLPPDAGLPHLGSRGNNIANGVWKLDYYQWAMQIFEQYNISDGACQFALAALEQVEEAFISSQNHPFDESATAIKGRLWANVFKFMLDLRQFYEAYCAIISNPDEESKSICLRRFVIVLYEGNTIKILCGGKLPFIGLVDKVEQELYWKAERSDILSKPNLYKLLYAFEMNRHSWRKAASYIYRYSSRLKTESTQQSSSDLQERLNGLSAAINTLHLIPSAYAWIGHLRSQKEEHYPTKKPRKTIGLDQEGDGCQSQNSECIDIEKIEDEFVLTSAEYYLSLSQVKWKFSEAREELPSLAGLLVQEDLYDMAFTVLLRFFKGSDLKRELEKVFCAMALKCCPDITDLLRTRTEDVLMLTSSKDEMVYCSSDMSSTTQQHKPTGYWVTLKLYLDKYRGFHARLPLIIADTLLRVDPQLELPLWLVNMFKDGQSEKAWRMTGQESSPALLFRLYVDYGRYTDATNLLLEYIESYVSMRPSEIMNIKRVFGVWLPYTAIQQLSCKIEEAIRLGHMVAQCHKLKSLLQAALLRHLRLLKGDSDDVCAAAFASTST